MICARILVLVFFLAETMSVDLVQASVLPLRTRVTLSQWEERCKYASDCSSWRSSSMSRKLLKQVRGGGGNKSRADKTKKTKNISDVTIVLQAGAAALMESAVLFGILIGAKRLSSQSIPLISAKLKGLPVLQWASFVLVSFGSSSVKNLIDGGMKSAASNQARNVNKVPGDAKWYASLEKPWFNPPSWVFPIMWVIVSKPTQLWAVSRLFRLSTDIAPKTALLPALAVYCTHLALGDVWNEVFFEKQRIKAGTVVITTFYGGLLASAELFGRIDDRAGFLMLPTVGWVTVATALNWEIYRLNRRKD